MEVLLVLPVVPFIHYTFIIIWFDFLFLFYSFQIIIRVTPVLPDKVHKYNLNLNNTNTIYILLYVMF